MTPPAMTPPATTDNEFLDAVVTETALGGRPTPMDPGVVHRVLTSEYGLSGTLRRVPTEKDDTFRLRTAEGDFMVKVSSDQEDPAIVDLQTRAMLHLEQVAPELPVQRVRLSTGSHPAVLLPSTGRFPRSVRVLHYVPGRLLDQAAPAASELAAAGDMLARVSLALRDFRHPRESRLLLWDVAHFARLGGLLDAMADPGHRDTAARIMQDFAEHVLPALPALETQVVHGDFSPYNMVVEPGLAQYVTGVFDFGDVVRTAALFDLAVPMANLLGGDPAQPWSRACAFLAGYHRCRDVTPDHAVLLREVALARLVLRNMVAAWQARRSPDRRAYLLSHTRADWANLAHALAVPPDEVRALLARTVNDHSSPEEAPGP